MLLSQGEVRVVEFEKLCDYVYSSRYNKTCSIFNLQDNGITFVRKEEYLENFSSTDKRILLIIPLRFKASHGFR